MDFGKHIDKPLERVPTSYLEWMLLNMTNLGYHTRKIVEDEVLFRRAEIYYNSFK
jgi:predicted nucleotidyltransferase